MKIPAHQRPQCPPCWGCLPQPFFFALLFSRQYTGERIPWRPKQAAARKSNASADLFGEGPLRLFFDERSDELLEPPPIEASEREIYDQGTSLGNCIRGRLRASALTHHPTRTASFSRFLFLFSPNECITPMFMECVTFGIFLLFEACDYCDCW